MRSFHSVARLGLASLLGALATLGASRAQADTATAAGCDATSLTCSVGSAALQARIKNQLPTQIDSGWMDKGLIKIRTRFTIDPVGADPLLAIDMPKGALVEATWSEAGYVNVTPVTEQGAQGSIKAHYTLTPSLDASIYGFTMSYNANELINKIPGAQFNYNAQAEAPLLPWGFAGGTLTVPPPALDQSTIFSIPFSDLGVDPGTVEGKLSIQAAASPTFAYVTKDVRLDAGSITAAGGSAKLAVGDDDFLDITASVAGQVTLGGTLDIRPVIVVDTVSGWDTYGLVKYSFSAVSKPIGGGEPMAVSFDNARIHIPLPNLKVPAATLVMGSIPAGQQAEKAVTIESTGELGGRLSFQSSDPQFVVPSGEVRVDPKSSYALKVVFKPSSDGAASATITVRSNDPGSPEQTFRVAANGAVVEGADESDPAAPRKGGAADLEAPPETGCACSTVAHDGGKSGGYAALLLGLGLGLAVAARRRRSR